MLDSSEQWGEWLFNSNELVVTLMLLIQDCNRSQDWTKPTEQIAEMLAKRFILLLRRKQIKESSRIARRLIAWQGALKFTGALSPTPKHCLRVSSALHRDPAGGKIHKDQMYKCDEDVRFDGLLSDTGLALWNGIKAQAFMAASGLEETVAHMRNRNQDQY